MINKLGQVILYIEDLNRSKVFWTEKLGFHVVDEELDTNEIPRIEISPEKNGTSIVLIDKNFVAEMDPEMNLDTPSLMFFADDLDQLYADFSDKGITLGKLVERAPGKRVFNFSDDEDNYFAVMEK